MHTVRVYGGEANEAIRYMQMEGCEPEPIPETAFGDGALSNATEQWLLQLEEQVRLIEALPFVKGQVKFYDSDKSANLNKVEAVTWCCWGAGQFKRVMLACDESGKKPTHLEAATELRLKLCQRLTQERWRRRFSKRLQWSDRLQWTERASNERLAQKVYLSLRRCPALVMRFG